MVSGNKIMIKENISGLWLKDNYELDLGQRILGSKYIQKKITLIN